MKVHVASSNVFDTGMVGCKKKVAKFRFVIVSARSSRTLHNAREPVARDFASMSRTCAQLSSRRSLLKPGTGRDGTVAGLTKTY